MNLADSENAKRLGRYRRESRGKTTAQLAIEWADSVLKSPIRIPALPRLAEEHTQRMAEVRRDPKGAGASDERAQQRRWQYDRWLADVAHELVAHGVRLLVELDKWAPGDVQRLEAVGARVATLIAALRDLKLPWWPIHRIDDDHTELSLLDHCQRELGRLDTKQISRGPEQPALDPEGWGA